MVAVKIDKSNCLKLILSEFSYSWKNLSTQNDLQNLEKKQKKS